MNLGVIGYGIFLHLSGQPVDKVRYLVYLDDFSIYIDDELVFKSEINSTKLEEMGWRQTSRRDDCLVLVNADNFHSSPYSIAILHTHDDDGRLHLSLNISEGWKSLNFTWYVMMPKSNWAPYRSHGTGLSLISEEAYHVGVRLDWWNQPNEQNLRTEAIVFSDDLGTGTMGERVGGPASFEFDCWHRLSLVLNSTSELGLVRAHFYLDGQQVGQIVMEQEYLHHLYIRWWS